VKRRERRPRPHQKGGPKLTLDMKRRCPLKVIRTNEVQPIGISENSSCKGTRSHQKLREKKVNGLPHQGRQRRCLRRIEEMDERPRERNWSIRRNLVREVTDARLTGKEKRKSLKEGKGDAGSLTKTKGGPDVLRRPKPKIHENKQSCVKSG